MGESARLRKFSVTGATAVLAVMLAGCGSGSGAATAPVSAAPPADGGTYGNVVDLRDAVVEAGLECPEWDEHNRNKLAATSATCSDSLVMATYASETSLENQMTLWKELGVESDFLIGKNWMVNSSDPEALRQKLGGTVFKVSGE